MRRCRRAMLLVAAVGAGLAHGPAFADTGEPSRDVVRVTRGTKAYTRPARSRAYQRGLVMRNSRFEVLERSAGTGCRGTWLRIDEHAWLCSSDTQKTAAAPGGKVKPRMRKGRSLPYTYVVTQDGHAHASIADISAGAKPRDLPGLGGFRLKGEETVNGVRFLKTRAGWIQADQARVVGSVEFRGVKLEPEDVARRLAFVVRKWARVYDESGKRTRAKSLPRHHYLGEVGPPVAAGDHTLHRLGEGRYLRARDIGIVEFAPPPASVGAGERWIDVKLSEQTLVAYEGERPVLATLVSTARSTTPLGEFRIQKKRPYARMESQPHYTRKWSVRAPWAITLDGRFAMHAVYWHDYLGRPVSMGCINLSPRDARWVWEFTQPALPPGWARIETREGTPATMVRVRE